MLPGFQFYHWDDEGNDRLVRHFPAYYATYRNYDQVIKKVDAVRFFYLYHVGGIYMDTDMACLRPFPPWLTNTTDVVLGVAAGQADFVPNAFMAAPRKHPFVAFLIQQLKYTSKHTRSVFATAGPAFLSAAVKWWKANVGTGLTLLPFEVLYADSSAKDTCSISEARIEADIRTCSESLPKSWVYSISAGTWCPGCPGSRNKSRAYLKSTGVHTSLVAHLSTLGAVPLTLPPVPVWALASTLR